MKRLLLLLFLPLTLFSQQLLKDPGFEALTYCPGGIAMLGHSVFWYSPTQGTPDLFNRCSGKSSAVAVPKNVCGKQKPLEGNGYAGLILYEYQYWDYKEYIQSELAAPLQKGGVYKLTFHISLSDNSMYAVDKVQAAITKNPVRLKGHNTMSHVTPQISFDGPDKGFFTNKKDWVKLSYDYTAEGGEQFITIGNFVPDKYGKRKQVKKSSDVASAYYYVDAVTFTQISPGIKEDESFVESLDNAKEDSLSEGSTFSLKNIQFETDKDILLEQSYLELNKVLRILSDYPLMELEIRGHTDDQASDAHNNDLSERRAIAVRKYLISKGVEPHRLTSKGFGETMPIADNTTEVGRALNRRVEFYVRKK